MTSISPDSPRTLTGIQIMRGEGALAARGFWAEAWSLVVRQPRAVFALTWISMVAFFAVFAPLLASGHPVIWQHLDAAGRVTSVDFPLLDNLGKVDWLLLALVLLGLPWMLLPLPIMRSQRLAVLLAAALQSALTAVLAAIVSENVDESFSTTWLQHAADWVQTWSQWPSSLLPAGLIAIPLALLFLWLAPIDHWWGRLALVLLVGAITAAACAKDWKSQLVNYDAYAEKETAGEARGYYTIIPWSPLQSRTEVFVKEPGTVLRDHAEAEAGTPIGRRKFLLGTDGVGRDVLSQLLHACRLSISIGLVSTSIAVLIGVTMGSLMGYFGGKVDLLLFRVVEVFMAIPVLFLLIVAAGVLPRNTYVMMAIIGCVTWTGAARFTRAEFLKLRSQDFVQSARAVGLPLRSVLFKHMLPNGVTPVLVDASFAIAAAILAEATLSYLGLGPDGQASWGKLLSGAANQSGDLVSWLAIYPGAAIFLTVLSYNLLGEAFRDAIDPKLKKPAAA